MLIAHVIFVLNDTAFRRKQLCAVQLIDAPLINIIMEKKKNIYTYIKAYTQIISNNCCSNRNNKLKKKMI